MTPRPRNRVRIALTGVLTLLVAALVIPSVSAQFPRQPFPGAPGMRPGMPDTQRMPEVPRGPQIPQPNFPQPQIPQPLQPGDRFGGMFERVWTCSKCSKEIGRGAFPPGTCPHCGARIINGMGGGDRPAQPDNNGGFNNAPGDRPEMQRRQGMQPPPPGGDFRGENFDPPQFNPQPAPENNWIAPVVQPAVTPDKTESSSISGVFWLVLGIVFGLGILLIIGLVLFAIMQGGGKKKARRRKPVRSSARKRYDDDDDDEYIPRSKRRRYDD